MQCKIEICVPFVCSPTHAAYAVPAGMSGDAIDRLRQVGLYPHVPDCMSGAVYLLLIIRFASLVVMAPPPLRPAFSTKEQVEMLTSKGSSGPAADKSIQIAELMQRVKRMLAMATPPEAIINAVVVSVVL